MDEFILNQWHDLDDKVKQRVYLITGWKPFYINWILKEKPMSETDYETLDFAIKQALKDLKMTV